MESVVFFTFCFFTLRNCHLQRFKSYALLELCITHFQALPHEGRITLCVLFYFLQHQEIAQGGQSKWKKLYEHLIPRNKESGNFHLMPFILTKKHPDIGIIQWNLRHIVHCWWTIILVPIAIFSDVYTQKRGRFEQKKHTRMSTLKFLNSFIPL